MPSDNNTEDPIVTEARRLRALREQGYRGQALRIFPHICARCGREFSGEKLRELTVHHKDHDHDNNPPDGTNWELLCLYCHDNEHQEYLDQDTFGSAPAGRKTSGVTHQPFAALGNLLKDKRK